MGENGRDARSSGVTKELDRLQQRSYQNFGKEFRDTSKYYRQFLGNFTGLQNVLFLGGTKNIHPRYGSRTCKLRTSLFSYWPVTDHRSQIVEFSSAVPEALPDAGRAAIHATHSDMCKFHDENSPGWNVLAGCLYDFSKQAPSVIERNWAQEQRRNLQATHDFVTNMIHSKSKST